MSTPNPWTDLPDRPDYVLPCDARLVHGFNERAAPRFKYDLSLLPEPYFGRPEAPVVLLALNPGRTQEDAEIHARKAFKEDVRKSLQHELTPNPFLHFNQDESTGGGRWWRRIAAPLIRQSGLTSVGKALFCLQLLPYHSESFGSPRLFLPSQEYSIGLVRAALARGAEVVVMRSRRLWERMIPELSVYERLHELRNPRNPSLSPGNLSSYDAIANRVRQGSQSFDHRECAGKSRFRDGLP